MQSYASPPGVLSRAAQELKAWRERQGLSQIDTARRFGVDQGRYSQFELGARKPGRALAVLIYDHTAIPVHLWDQAALERVG